MNTLLIIALLGFAVAYVASMQSPPVDINPVPAPQPSPFDNKHVWIKTDDYGQGTRYVETVIDGTIFNYKHKTDPVCAETLLKLLKLDGCAIFRPLTDAQVRPILSAANGCITITASVTPAQNPLLKVLGLTPRN